MLHAPKFPAPGKGELGMMWLKPFARELSGWVGFPRTSIPASQVNRRYLHEGGASKFTQERSVRSWDGYVP